MVPVAATEAGQACSDTYHHSDVDTSQNRTFKLRQWILTCIQATHCNVLAVSLGLISE